MSFFENLDERGGAAIAEKQPFFVAPPMQAGAEGEATMVFLFPCSDYSQVRANVSRFVESTFGMPEIRAESPALSVQDETEANRELEEVIA